MPFWTCLRPIILSEIIGQKYPMKHKRMYQAYKNNNKWTKDIARKDQTSWWLP